MRCSSVSRQVVPALLLLVQLLERAIRLGLVLAELERDVAVRLDRAVGVAEPLAVELRDVVRELLARRRLVLELGAALEHAQQLGVVLGVAVQRVERLRSRVASSGRSS